MNNAPQQTLNHYVGGRASPQPTPLSEYLCYQFEWLCITPN